MKRLSVIIMIFIVIALAVTACSPGSTTAPAKDPVSTTTVAVTKGKDETETTTDKASNGGMIAPDGITVQILFPPNSGLRPSMDTTEVWEFIREETGITFDLIINQSSEQKDLMFASRDFPDMMASVGASALQLQTAAEDGDLVMLDPLLEEYAPTWMRFFDENPLVRNLVAQPDGHLYTLPFCCHDPQDRELRDQWLYIYTWLEELNLEVPTTTDDFKETLTAVKEAAGTGTIPDDVIPYYYLYDSYVGGQFDVYGSFGIIVTTNEYLGVMEDGTVVCQAVNPDIKEPLKYLRELYQLELTPPECFTDDWNAYLSKISANPPVTFSYGSFANRLPDVTYPMAPLDSGNGKKPIMRRQAYSTNPTHATAIFSNCEYQVELAMFFEWAAQYDNAFTVGYGIQDTVWGYNEDGKMTLIFWESDQEKMNELSEYVGFNNSWFSLQPKDLFDNHYYSANYEIAGTREWGFANIYKNYLPHEKSVYLAGALDEDSTTMMQQYAADLNSYRKKTFADWITGTADIDNEWDAYVAEMENLKLNEWLAYKQEAYDILMK